jgi:hypothetical protein
MPDSISTLAEELMHRELAKNPDQFKAAVPPTPVNRQSLHPELLALIGSLADAGSTYSFLKRGTGVEDNMAFAGANNRPFKTAAGVAGSALGSMGGRWLLRKAGFKGIADLLARHGGGQQLGLAGQNLQFDLSGRIPIRSDTELQQKIHEHIGGFTR